MYLALDDREDLPEKVLTEMKLTRKWVLAIVGDKWPLQHRHVLGRAVRIRSPYVDVLSLTQVLALKSLRKKVDKEELSHGKREGYTYLILCTVSGVASRPAETRADCSADRLTKVSGEVSVPINGAGLPARVIRP